MGYGCGEEPRDTGLRNMDTLVEKEKSFGGLLGAGDMAVF